MPSYAPKVLTDQQLSDIWAYIKTLPTSASPSVGARLSAARDVGQVVNLRPIVNRPVRA
jgi:hypothetical protein